MYYLWTALIYMTTQIDIELLRSREAGMKKERVKDKLLHIYMNNHAHRAPFSDIICTDGVNNMNMTM